jgi:hypothetical protein
MKYKVPNAWNRKLYKNDNITICIGDTTLGIGFQIRTHLKSKTYDMSHIWEMICIKFNHLIQI